MKKILIVDDDEDLCEILQYNLSYMGYYTVIANSAEAAMKRSLKSFDLILLEVILGPMSGFKFADKMRNEMKLNTPVIFLTSKNTENDILTGFSIGAADYVTKPFSINELDARIKAVLRRTFREIIKLSDSIMFGGIELNTSQGCLRIDNEKEDLTRKEYEILKLMLENQGKLFSRKDILKKIWGQNVEIKERSVDVNMTNLRTKLGKYSNCLHSKPGYGYFFEF